MSSEYRTKLIRRAVDANTSPNVAATALQDRVLHKFFESPQCADIVYMKIIERGEWAVSGLAQPISNSGTIRSGVLSGTLGGGGTNTVDSLPGGLEGSSNGGTMTASALGKIGAFTRNPGVGDGGDKVLLKCVRLLKTYLLLYYPSDSVLAALDRFCYQMEGIFEDGAKSFEYIRALVDAISRSRHNPYLSSLASTSTPSGTNTATTANGNAISNQNQNQAASTTTLNNLHFNTAPTGVLASGLTNNQAQTTAPSITTLNTVITGPPSSGRTSPPHHRHSASLPGSVVEISNGMRITTLAPALLTPNFIAARVRLVNHRHLPHLLDSLLCSSIFGGRIPKGLLDVFAEHVDPFLKLSPSAAAASNLSSTQGQSSPFATPSNPLTPVGRGAKSTNTETTLSGASTAPSTPGSERQKDTMQSSYAQHLSVHLTAASKRQHNHPARAFLFSLHDQDLRERIATVSVSKKQEERALYRTIRRGQPLFQYKHYNEQLKLDISAAQIDAIVQAMIQSANHESRLLASKILIKLIMDMYCHDPIEVASAALLSILLELTSQDQPIDTKIHAFNLIFNLSTHLHMFEEVSFFGHSSHTHSASNSPSSQPQSGATPTMNRLQSELFFMVKELLLIQFQQGETSRKLWFSALSCLLYFMTDAGVIETEKLQGLDPRVIGAFFKNLEYINDSIWRHLVRILVNRLYLEGNRSTKKFSVPSHEFIAQVMLLGQKPGSPVDAAQLASPTADKAGIRFIVELYKRSRSMEAQDNLFCVIFDYIHYCYRRMIRSNMNPSSNSVPVRVEANQTVRPSTKASGAGSASLTPLASPSSNAPDPAPRKYSGPPTSTQFSYVFELLVRIDAPHYFASIFKYPPPNFVNHVLGLISHVAHSSPDGEMLHLLNQTDPIVLRRVLKDFACLADLLTRMTPSYAEDCAVLLSEPANLALLHESLRSITSLIQGKAANDASSLQAIPYERLQGSLWMQQLMQIVWNVRLGLASVPIVESRNKTSVGSVTVKPRSRKDSSNLTGSNTYTTSGMHGKHGRKSSRDHTAEQRVSDPSTEKSPRVSIEHARPDPLKEKTKDHGTKDSKESHAKDHKDSKDHAKDHGKDHGKDHPKSEKLDKSDGTGHHIGRETSPHKDASSHKDPSSHHTSLGASHHKDHHHDKPSSSTKHQGTLGPKVHPVNLAAIPGHSTLGSSLHGATSPKDGVPLHLLPTRGLHLRKAESSFVDAVENTFHSYVKSADPIVRRSYLRIVEAGMIYLMNLSDQGPSGPLRNSSGSIPRATASPEPGATSGAPPKSPRLQSMLLDAEVLAKKSFELLNNALLKLIKVGQETTETNLQMMFDMIIQFTMLVPLPQRTSPHFSRNSSLLIEPMMSRSRSPSGNSINTATPNTPGSAVSAQISSPREKLRAHSQTLKSPGRGEYHSHSYDHYNLSDSDESFGSEDIGTWTPQGESSNSVATPSSPQLDRLGRSDSPLESSAKAVDMMDLNSQDDSPAGLFMQGKVDIVRGLLEQVHIDILLHLFTHLPPRMNGATRPVVLHFLTERCKHSSTDLDAVGGSSFFKQLLTENDPLISYLASRFLIDKLQKEQPENFNMVVNTLLAKAVDLNDEKLVSNPYLQIKAIFEMNTTLRRKEHGAIFPL